MMRCSEWYTYIAQRHKPCTLPTSIVDYTMRSYDYSMFPSLCVMTLLCIQGLCMAHFRKGLPSTLKPINLHMRHLELASKVDKKINRNSTHLFLVVVAFTFCAPCAPCGIV